MKKTIFLVEDDAALSEGLSLLLADEGYDVQSFTNFIDMKTKLKGKSPDLFVLDYRLPGEDGILIAKYLRTVAFIKNVPIILMSATQPNLMKQEKTSAIDAYFPKPFEMADFLLMVNNLTH